jgi:hypothetical protein
MWFNENDGDWAQAINNFKEVDDCIQLMNQIATLKAGRQDFYDQNNKPHFARTRIYIVTRKPNCRFRQFIYSDSQNSLFFNRFTSYESWLYFLIERVNHPPALRKETHGYIEKIKPVIDQLEFSYKNITPDDWVLDHTVSLNRVEVYVQGTNQYSENSFTNVDSCVNNLFYMFSNILNQTKVPFTFVLAFTDGTRWEFEYEYSLRDIKYGSVRFLLRSYCVCIGDFSKYWGPDTFSILSESQKVAQKLSKIYW